MKPILIAEIGMCHNGSIDTFKEMIRVARDAGATMVKSQAFMHHDVKGSMPAQFYKDRQLNVVQCIEMILFSREMGIELFFSIFSKEYDGIKGVQKWHKYAATQSANSPKMVENDDKFNVIASVNSMQMLPRLKNAVILYAGPYLGSPSFEQIIFLNEWYGRQVGFSDHSIGIENCVRARHEYNAHVIEKHFVLNRDIYYEGVQFRDAIHGATPKELERLAKEIM